MMPMASPEGPAAPASGPTGNAGASAAALTKVNEAVQLLQSALPEFPVGSEIQKAVLDSVTKLSKVAPASAAVPGVQMTTLQGLGREAQESQMLQQLTRSLGQQTGAPMPSM